MSTEANKIEHPLGPELAGTIRATMRLRELKGVLSKEPVRSVTERIETPDEVINIITTPKNKQLEEVMQGLRDNEQKTYDLLFQIPQMYRNPSLEYRTHMIYVGFSYQVEDVGYAHWYLQNGIRIVKGQNAHPELEVTGKKDDFPILHAPEGWKLLVEGGRASAFERLRDGSNRGWYDEEDVDSVRENVYVFWRPELPSEPKILFPKFAGGKGLLRENSKLYEMTLDELRTFPGHYFTTEASFSDSYDLTNLDLDQTRNLLLSRFA